MESMILQLLLVKSIANNQITKLQNCNQINILYPCSIKALSV